ncbi:Polyketide cyclase / dehydrase and lipid transport [Saccharomonospora marina XMU15]|uniref:Polyketide cyclase / dehydrase and lipid transport n=1 Tax=Saccharomonospora marina XMU15 TaxID=882083 RepID=H5X439_9PSEU|nr:SRPBCC family protein [Saccharomonospora marina]EHR53310.1 Polyketide cyclase / dehydrase and lipid transport [Saccharomonospora marina XMU15]
MANRTYSFEVRRSSTAPPQQLFELETDGANWSRWARPLVMHSSWERRGEPEDGGIGAIRKVGAWPLFMREQTTGYEPPHRHVYTFAGTAPVRDYHAEVLLSPDGSGGTLLCWRATFTEAVPGTGPLAKLMLHAAVRFLATRLVAAAERG